MGEQSTPHSPEELMEAMRSLAEATDEGRENDPGIQRYHELPAYQLDVLRDGSEAYFKALAEAMIAITSGDYGSIDYKGYLIYYSDAPQVSSISIKDGHMEYSYHITFYCDALEMNHYEEYHSEEERKGFLDPDNPLFQKTLEMLDNEIEMLDEGKWIKKKETLDIYDFKDYSPERLIFPRIEWEDRIKEATETFSYLLEDALMRANGLTFAESDFDIFADVIRRMVFLADYGKRNYLFQLDGFIQFKWKPVTKRERYIWRCMDEFGYGDLPDRLVDNCATYYFLDDPQGFEALAYLLSIAALMSMCEDYDADQVKDGMLKVFDLIPDNGYRARLEKLIEEDRKKAEKGESEYDQKDI